METPSRVKPEVRLRRATGADARILWTWANDPVVRAAAFHPEPIPWASHVQWLDARLRSERCLLFIAESGGRPVGQVRFDVEPGGTAEIDVSIAAESRGRGLGAAVLRLACDAYHAHASETLVAHVRPDNVASARAFERAGFARAGTERVAGCQALRLERPLPAAAASR